jgi:hypothetical protein
MSKKLLQVPCVGEHIGCDRLRTAALEKSFEHLREIARNDRSVHPIPINACESVIKRVARRKIEAPGFTKDTINCGEIRVHEIDSERHEDFHPGLDFFPQDALDERRSDT